VIRRHAADYVAARGGAITRAEARVLAVLAACRTAALGGHRERCAHCGHSRVAYNSCRNRHCPKCQGAARAKWLEARRAELLPVQYFHVVFTLPHTIAPLALANKSLVYGLLFRAAWETLREVAADPKHLGAAVGMLAVLHTWGQRLEHHPHLHCVVPGGGLSADGVRWVSCRPGFFLPVRVLSRLFRGKFLAALRGAFERGELVFSGPLAPLADPVAWRKFLSAAYATEWVVYAKPPFGGPEQVLKYLARYTHRVAISNHRLVRLENGQVTFRFKNYAQQSRWQMQTLSAVSFLRRFLLHLLPRGFVRIRSYGLLAPRDRRVRLEHCRRLLSPSHAAVQFLSSSHAAVAPPAVPPLTLAPRDATTCDAAPADTEPRCPMCGHGRLIVIEQWPRPRIAQLLARSKFWNTS
jgi:hypothetical protein